MVATTMADYGWMCSLAAQRAPMSHAFMSYAHVHVSASMGSCLHVRARMSRGSVPAPTRSGPSDVSRGQGPGRPEVPRTNVTDSPAGEGEFPAYRRTGSWHDRNGNSLRDRIGPLPDPMRSVPTVRATVRVGA